MSTRSQTELPLAKRVLAQVKPAVPWMGFSTVLRVLADTYVRPIDNGRITTGFNGYPGHCGVDYAVPTGTIIRVSW